MIWTTGLTVRFPVPSSLLHFLININPYDLFEILFPSKLTFERLKTVLKISIQLSSLGVSIEPKKNFIIMVLEKNPDQNDETVTL